ncbi:DMT family transporter [Marinomonas sp. 15G1-11]|uniref:DMT family transporter n=1 Tax=Marinomonas phaeophyticola TaxID=3004091 RepID=A0ABT4JVB3_9GAMM|nr:DMT family transporter [Marinomonas sp. 15G1-11]MCZ2721499.1 DMT family transporter [Marinomonas sp. 15G1-11]
MWIFSTLIAAWFQSMRTAYQNSLSKEFGTLHATLARSLFGLPFVVIYGVFCWLFLGPIQSAPSMYFYLAAFIGAIAQVAATYLMLNLFKTESFASGTLFAKTEAIMTALLGLLLFASALSTIAWIGVFLGVVGIIILSVKTKIAISSFFQTGPLFGLSSGFCFAITSLAVTYASHELEGNLATRAALTLILVLSIQSLLLWSVQSYLEKSVFSPFTKNIQLSNKVGFFSAIGSIGWFTAFSLANPALVKTLGQIEVIGTLYYSKYRFSETISTREWIGGGFILTSVAIVAFASFY